MSFFIPISLPVPVKLTYTNASKLYIFNNKRKQKMLMSTHRQELSKQYYQKTYIPVRISPFSVFMWY